MLLLFDSVTREELSYIYYANICFMYVSVFFCEFGCERCMRVCGTVTTETEPFYLSIVAQWNIMSLSCNIITKWVIQLKAIEQQ